MAAGCPCSGVDGRLPGPYSSLLLSTITDIRVGDECEFVEKMKVKDSSRRLISKAASAAGSSSGRLDVDDVDVSCCVSFVALKRRLDCGVRAAHGGGRVAVGVSACQSGNRRGLTAVAVFIVLQYSLILAYTDVVIARCVASGLSTLIRR